MVLIEIVEQLPYLLARDVLVNPLAIEGLVQLGCKAHMVVQVRALADQGEHGVELELGPVAHICVGWCRHLEDEVG